MKFHLACAIAALAVAACSPTETKPAAAAGDAPAKPAAAAVTLAPVSLVGQWTGTITCYKVESPLTVKIDAATPDKAEVNQGGLTWAATVSVDSAANVVTLTGPQPTADAAVIAGPLSADGKAITGKMEKQLCTDVSLKRAG